MSGEPINGWDAAVLLGSEASIGVTPNPTAAQAFEIITCDTGISEVGDTRGKKDRNAGRGMQSDFVEGRVKPLSFSIEASCKSRALVDTVPKESAIYKAAGLLETVNAATNVTYSMVADPVASAAFSHLSIYRSFGKGSYVFEAEQVRGCVIKTLGWSGGDKELTLKAGGDAIGKYHLGYSASVTMLIGATTLTFANAEEGYRFGQIGWYQCESEIIKVTAMNYSTFTATIARAQLGSVAAAHTAVPWRPYIPALTYLGSPISEGSAVSVTVDGQAIRSLSWHLDLVTGMDLLPGESGSKYIQGAKVIRYDWKGGARLAMKREDAALLGKSTQRKLCAVTIVQGSAVGGIYTFSLPYCEVMPFKVPDTANDVSIIDIAFRVRDSAGNDAATITLS